MAVVNTMTEVSAVDNHSKTDKQTEAPQFSSKIALICSCLGCVIGSGNIWRFPRIVANNGGDEGCLVFILVWFLFLLFWSIPMLLVEYGCGRYTGKAVIGCFHEFVGKKFTWCGAWICMVNFFIVSYYSVVLGWCFYYSVYWMTSELPDNVQDSRQIFKDFAEESAWPVLTHALAVLVAGASVIGGVKTIEKVNLALVPVLLVILIFTFIWSMTREYASHGLTYLFTQEWDTFYEPRLWVDALSQNAFDTSAGMGIFISYAAYMTRSDSVVRYAVMIPVTNNLISLISGMMIFSTVFSSLIPNPDINRTDIVDIIKDSGPGSTGLTFIWLPVLFSSIGVFGRVVCILFFVCLSFAGVTSMIAMIELVTHSICDFGVSRKIATPITSIAIFLVGLMSSLNLNILTNQDFVWGFALIVNGIMLQAMVIIYGVSNFRRVVFNDYGYGDWHVPKIWEYIIKFVAPIEGVVLIIWWAIDLILTKTDDGVSWYEYGIETFMTTITQWLILMSIMIIINVVVNRLWNPKDSDEYEPIYDKSELQSKS